MSKSFVAYLDILGFSLFLKKNSPATARSLIENWIAKWIYISQTGHAIQRDIRSVNSLFIFDTIVIWIEGNSVSEFHDILSVTSSIMTGLFHMGFPVRGAIAYGDFLYSPAKNNTGSTIANHSVLLSSAYLDAKDLEDEKHKWSGCVIHESVWKIIDLSNPYVERSPYLIHYDVPLKNNEYRSMWVIKWCTGLVAPNGVRERVIEVFSSHEREISSDSIIDKINNTTKFIEDVITDI